MNSDGDIIKYVITKAIRGYRDNDSYMCTLMDYLELQNFSMCHTKEFHISILNKIVEIDQDRIFNKLQILFLKLAVSGIRPDMVVEIVTESMEFLIDENLPETIGIDNEGVPPISPIIGICALINIYSH
jgi:hypothetical protein